MASVPPNTPTDANARVPTILVVEDEAFVRFYTADLLRDHGFRVLEAAEGSEALAMLDGEQPVDLVFSDITLPGDVDGFGLAQRLRKRAPNIPVILTSGRYSEAAARQVCQDELFLAKPYDISELLSCIHALLTDLSPGHAP